jgi:hypothetical protein
MADTNNFHRFQVVESATGIGSWARTLPSLIEPLTSTASTGTKRVHGLEKPGHDAMRLHSDRSNTGNHKVDRTKGDKL